MWKWSARYPNSTAMSRADSVGYTLGKTEVSKVCQQKVCSTRWIRVRRTSHMHVLDTRNRQCTNDHNIIVHYFQAAQPQNILAGGFLDLY